MDDSAYEAMVDACEQAYLETTDSPRLEAFYHRLTLRMMNAMERAKLLPAQMDVVVDTFLDCARELAEDAQRELAARRAPPEPDYVIPARKLTWDAPKIIAEPEPTLVELDVSCAACRRSLGRTLIPEACRPLVEPMKCPGCLREGR